MANTLTNNGTFPDYGIRPKIMAWNGTPVTDQGRSQLTVSIDRIESKQRMADGTLRKYHIADKKTISCSWAMVPADTQNTFDGKMGGKEMRSFFNRTKGVFAMRLTYGDGVTEDVSVMFNDFSHDVVKRWAGGDYWNVTASFEEV